MFTTSVIIHAANTDVAAQRVFRIGAESLSVIKFSKIPVASVAQVRVDACAVADSVFGRVADRVFVRAEIQRFAISDEERLVGRVFA